MKKLTQVKSDHILTDHGLDIVGVELEFASTVNHNNFLRTFLDENNDFHRRLSTSINPRPILVDDNNLPRETVLGFSSPHFDSSISVDINFPNQLELTSSPIPLSLVPVYIKDISHKTKDWCTVTPTCGTHFHFNSNQLKWTDLKKLALGIVPFEPFFYMMSLNDRTTLKYCKPMGYIFTLEDLLYIKDKRDLAYLFVKSKRGEPSTTAKCIGKYGTNLYPNHGFPTNTRYMGLNLFSHFFRGTIEFRYFQNKSWQENLVFFNLLKRIMARIFLMSTEEILQLIYEVTDLNRLDYMNRILSLLNIEEDSFEYYLLTKIYTDRIDSKVQFISARSSIINGLLGREKNRKKKIVNFISPEAGPGNKKLYSLINSNSLFIPSFVEWISEITGKMSGNLFDGYGFENISENYIPLGKIESFSMMKGLSRCVRNQHGAQENMYLSDQEEKMLLIN